MSSPAQCSVGVGLALPTSISPSGWVQDLHLQICWKDLSSLCCTYVVLLLDVETVKDAIVTFLVHDVPEWAAASLGRGQAASGGPAAVRGGLGGHQ